VRAISPNDKIDVGIVGCGVRGNYILGEAIAAGAGRINVVGICDVWKWRARRWRPTSPTSTA
jgi:predicted dehydrogenase